MPLVRRIPKRGFTHKRAMRFEIVNLKTLNRFPKDSEVDPRILAEEGFIRSHGVRLKILGEGELSHPLKVRAHRFSKSALEKIVRAGGTAESLPC